LEPVRRLLPLAFVFLIVGLSTAMAAPFLTLFLNQAVHASPVQVAVYLAAAPVAAVVVSTVIGRWSDRLRSRRWLLAGTALAGCAGTAVTATVRWFPVLLAVAVTVTAAAGATMSQVFAYARESLAGSARVATTISSLRSLFSLSWVAGPPLAALLLGAGGFRLVYGGASAMYAAAALVVLTGFTAPRHPEGGSGPGVAAGTDAPRRVIVLTLVAFVLGRCAGTLAVQGLSLFTLHDLHGSVRDAGLVLGLSAGLEIPLMIGFGVVAGRVPLRLVLAFGTGCGVAYAVLVAVSTTIWPVALGQVLNAAAIAAATGLGVTYVQDMMPRHVGRASTLYSNTFQAGQVLAGPVLGAAQQAGYRMPYVVGAVLGVVSLGLLVVTRGPAAAESDCPAAVPATGAPPSAPAA
jgi:MFS transporter, SET family, sugar efflux transporter